MFCSSHKREPLGYYCTECRKSMCHICTEVDNKHAGQHRNIRQEIQHRKDELQGITMEFKVKKSTYLDTCTSLQELVKDKMRVKNETRKLIQETLSVLKQLLGALEEQHNQEIQDLNEKIQDIQRIVERMESAERAAERQLSVSDQDMHHQMDMLFCIRESLESIIKKPLPNVDFQMQAENFTDVITQLQMLIERMTGEKEAASAILERASNKVGRTTKINSAVVGKQRCVGAIVNVCSVMSPAKRKNVQEKALQTPPKAIRTGPHDHEQRISTSQASCLEDQPGTSSATAGVSHATGSDKGDSDAVRNDVEEVSDTGSWFPSFISESTEPGEPVSLDSGPEAESSDEEPLDATLLESSQSTATACFIGSPVELSPGLGTLVFFDLKILTGKILHLAAIGDNSNCFKVTFQHQLVRDRGDMKTSLCEHGLDNFLTYLHTLAHPILVGYNLLSNILDLVTTLQKIKKEESFAAAIVGFLDALPFIKEKNPSAPNYTLKYFARLFFQRQLNDTQAEDCAQTLKDLCSLLDINPVMGISPVMAYSNIQCYISLQPLQNQKLLSKTSAQTLALHNVDLSKLQSVYEDNPGFGLQRFAQILNSNLSNNEKKIRHLSKIRSYFQAHALAAELCTPAPTNMHLHSSHFP